MDPSSAFVSVSRSLLLSKQEQFGCTKMLLTRLSDYLTNSGQARDEKTSSCVNGSGNLQRVHIFPYLFPKCISCLHVNFHVQLTKYAEELTPFQSIYRTDEFPNFSNTLSFFRDSPLPLGLNLTKSKCVQCLCALSRPAYRADPSLISACPSIRYIS